MISILVYLLLFFLPLAAMNYPQGLRIPDKFAVHYEDGTKKEYSGVATAKLLKTLSCDKYTLEALKECLEEKAYPNWPNEHGETAIFLVIKRSGNNREITPQAIDLLMHYGANLNYPDEKKERQTPLHLAATGYGYTAKLLLERGANIDEQDRNGNTPLHIAAHRGKVEVARLLIKHGAKLNISNRCRSMPLHRCFEYYSGECLADGWTVERDKKEVALFLIENGANCNAADAFGRGTTPLRTAIMERDYTIMQALLKHGADANDTSNKSFDLLWNLFHGVDCRADITPLQNAARLLFRYNMRLSSDSGWLRHIKRNYKVDLEALYKKVHQEQQEAFAVFAGHFLSNISCAHSAKQIMTSLQEIFRRVGYNWKFHELPLPSITPIHQLLHALKTKECTADYAQKTIDDGACLFLSHGIPLRKAIKYSAAPAVLETLIHAGASVHQLYEGKDNKYTPLHYAAACNNREAINVLCTHGADPNMPNNRKETPLFICCRHSRNKDLTDEEKVKRALTAVALLEHTADANYKNRNGDTPLHIVAIKKQNVRLAKVLLAGGANVNAQSNSDNTPMHYCFYYAPAVGIAKILIQAGADLTIKNWLRDTPHDSSGYYQVADGEDNSVTHRFSNLSKILDELKNNKEQ